MKIIMRTHIAGEAYSFKPGDVTDYFNDKEAVRLIEKGYADPFVDDDRERAIQPRGERRRKSGVTV